MAPNPTYVPYESESVSEHDVNKPEKEFPKSQLKPVWSIIIGLGVFHVFAAYGFVLIFTSAKVLTTLFALFLNHIAIMGITAGVHRLWSHRAYKAKLPLRILLMVMQTVAHQSTVIHWARDHRTHHKNSDSEADPHNSTRGFFYAHIGWLLCEKTPAVIEQRRKIDVSDLYADPVLTFQKKYYYSVLMPLICFILPTVIPVYLWNETWTNAFFVPTMFRWILGLHLTFTSNSIAHRWGSKPYEKEIVPVENKILSIFLLGEAWHNFHHIFPWDYRAAEYGSLLYNNTTSFINFFAKFGWAYDLKTASNELIQKRAERTGDGSHEIWGWSDENPNAKKKAVILHKKK